jgi:plastocyanin
MPLSPKLICAQAGTCSTHTCDNTSYRGISGGGYAPVFMRRRSGALVLAALVALVTVACGDDGDSDAADDAADLEDVVVIEGSEAEVDSLDNSFNPQNIQVAPGTTVVWENKGRTDHDIVPAGEDQPGEWGVDRSAFGPGDVYEHTFEEPGIYRYYCTLHGTDEAGMIGAVVVDPGEG